MPKVDEKTVIIATMGIAAIIGVKTITNLLERIGIFSSKESKSYDDHVTNPKSFWNPLMWKDGPADTLILKNQFCEWMYKEIYNSFSFWGDNEDRIYAAFHSLKTQSQLSYFSYWMQENKNINLLSWLIGSNIGPWGDHLSASEINKITQYFNRLPKYKI